MATCKDCLHCKSCGGFIPTDLDRDVFHYCREGRPDEISDIEERCSDFNDRRNYVEVVRCKDCKWFADNNGGEWFGCSLFNAIRAVPEDAPKDNDFCCWGEMKDND